MPPRKKIKHTKTIVKEAVENIEQHISKSKPKETSNKWNVITLFYERLKKTFTLMDESGLFNDDSPSSDIEDMFQTFKEWTKNNKSSFQYPVGGQKKKNKNGCPEFCTAHYQKSKPIYTSIIDEYITSQKNEI